MLKILEATADVALGVSDLFVVLLKSGYGASYVKMQYELSKIRRQRENPEIRIRRNYHALLFRLKRDGLIKRNKDQKIILTSKGKNKLKFLKDNKKIELPSVSFLSETSVKFTVFTFDVPERERRKRDWLRIALNNLGLTMLQKSVWIGKVKLPPEFISSLRDLKLLDYVEIFEISKTGTLRHIV